MSQLSKLLVVSEAEKQAILKEHNITEKEFEEAVYILREWISKSEHLPKEADDNKLRVMLLNSKMSIEQAKHSLEGYYRVRTLYSEFFDKMLPFTEEFEKCKLVCKSAAMPKLTPNLCRITVVKLCDPDGTCEDALLYQLISIMMTELRIRHDCYLSNMILIDLEEYGWKNVMKFTPTVNQKLVDMLMAVNLRIHSVHFINIPAFMDHIMSLIKMLIPGKIVSKIQIHRDRDSLFKAIPPQYLPKDYGGTEESLDELHAEWCQQMEENEEYFQKLRMAKSTKKIEMDQNQREMFGIGSEGTFKKLLLD